jgi:5-methylcytosine-specific restriction protein A
MATIETPEGRPFRSEESYLSERISRSMVEPFLKQKGYTDIEDVRPRYGMNESQLVSAVDPNGEQVKLHVQLCWRRGGGDETEKGRSANQHQYSAAQLLAKIKDGDWEGTIQAKLQRDASHGVTHSLFVQREGARFVHAACVPLKAVLPIWKKQRTTSQRLIDQGASGPRKTKNHAANGSSPTIWLQDDRTPGAHRVADALWGHKGVVDLVQLEDQVVERPVIDDTFDDCPVDYSQLGADCAPRVPVLRSMVKRDDKVRREVMNRAQGMCESEGCDESRSYPGFFDVHHILGVEKSDRVWNCVALCPNCHREAHFAPMQDAINAALLEYASKYRPK